MNQNERQAAATERLVRRMPNLGLSMEERRIAAHNMIRARQAFSNDAEALSRKTKKAKIGWVCFDDEHLIEVPTTNLIVRFLCGMSVVVLSVLAYLTTMLFVFAFFSCWIWIPFVVLWVLAINPWIFLWAGIAIVAGVSSFWIWRENQAVDGKSTSN